MARLKKISEEERAAKNELRKMGVSDYELNRLYDANYKARQRVSELTGAELADLGNKGKPLSLSWQQVLRQARQAETQGKTATRKTRRPNLTARPTRTTPCRKVNGEPERKTQERLKPTTTDT